MTLRRIRIQGLGVIDDAELELRDGLNVITGETGAGKTMVVSGLGLLLGARADAGLVRAGTRTAVVEGEVDVPVDHPASRRVEDAGGDVGEGLLLVRTVAAEGRSRAHVGGRGAPVSVLAEVGQHLVAVHGQADQWRLRDADQHRVLIDGAGGEALARCRATYVERYEEWLATRSRLAELRRTSAERARRVGMLRGALEEIEAVAPVAGEEDTLRAETERLTHAEELRNAAVTTHDLLVGSDDPGRDETSVTALVAAAGTVLAPAGVHDEVLDGLRKRLDEIGYLASDLAAELASYGSGIEVDEARLDEVHARRAELSSLLRKYGPTTSELLAFSGSAAAELAQIDVSEDDLAALEEQVAALAARVGEAGAELSRLRTETAERVGREVTAELAHLAMGSAQVQVHVAPRLTSTDDDRAEDAPAEGAPSGDRAAGAGSPVAGDDDPDPSLLHDRTVPLPDGTRARAGSHGLDDIEIRLAANPGAPARSVTRAASGGELSRVMLALELVCMEGQVPTYVFDEVDAGVGGAAALDLGARLARLAATTQVIVVTHLGQVAAHADHHLVVRKSTDGQVTRSDVAVVEGAEREAELARMLGGVADSEAALDHARELLARREGGR